MQIQMGNSIVTVLHSIKDNNNECCDLHEFIKLPLVWFQPEWELRSDAEIQI